jgi:two-component system response regulator YesN
LKNTLDNERTERQNLEYIKRQLAESIPLLRERFLSHLIEGKSDRKTIRERIRYFNLAMPLEGAYLCLVSGFVHRREGENSDIDLLTRRHILEGLLETLPKSGKPAPGIPFQDRDDRLCFLTWGKDAVNLYREGLKIAESICRDMQAARIKDCIIGVGEPVYTLEALPASYNSSVEALVAATLKGKNGVTTYREAVGKTGTATVENLPKWEKNITSALKIDNGEEACRIINEMFSYLQKTHFSFGEYHIEFVLLLTALMRCCDDLEIPKEEIFPSGADSFAMLPMQLPTGISQLKNLGEIKAWFSGLVERISGYIQIRKEKFARSKVREALDYLETNYSDPNLSLRNLCKKLAISMSYFSANLKNYHNKTFVEELTRIRINKAMELLRTTDLMVYEVAEKIGYRDAHYFSLSFHKFTGLTTQEYRNRNAQNRQ